MLQRVVLTRLLNSATGWRIVRAVIVVALASCGVTLSTAIANADVGCYTIVNSSSHGIEVQITYANNIVPLPTDGSATPVTIGLPKGDSSEQLCFNSGTYAEFSLDDALFQTNKKGLVMVGDVTGAVAHGNLVVVDDPAPKPKPKPPDPFKGFLTPDMPYVTWNYDDLHAGDCTLAKPKAILRADGSLRLATILSTAKTYSGDVWHSQLSLQRPSTTEQLGSFDSPTVCPDCNRMHVGNMTPVPWVINTKVDLDFFAVTNPPPSPELLQEFTNDGMVSVAVVKASKEEMPFVCPSNTAQFIAWSNTHPASSRACHYAAIICAKQKDGSITDKIIACDALSPGQGMPGHGSFVDNTVTAKYGWPPNDDSKLWLEMYSEPSAVKLIFGPNSC